MKYKLHPNTIDLVIGGPDFSGTSTQVADIIHFYSRQGKRIRDMRGDIDAATFHAERFRNINQYHFSLNDFLSDPLVTNTSKDEFRTKLGERKPDNTNVRALLYPAMIKNDVSTYINPNSADVWILEEPTHRGAGETCRTIELNRAEFHSEPDEESHATSHSVYRMDEFLRFRRPLREIGKTIIRSRSEESACYQIYDKEFRPNGCNRSFYLSLPGHKAAFANPPTHIFIACAPADMTIDDYLAFKQPRLNRNREDNLEKDVGLQMLVNKRYSTNWLEELYEEGCAKFNASAPKIYRFDMRLPKEDIKMQMHEKLKDIVEVTVNG